MRRISALAVQEAVEGLCIKANTRLRRDVYHALQQAVRKEKNPRAKKALKAILDNADIAAAEHLAICQDTGLPVVFLQVGQNVQIEGDLKKAVVKGVENGYKKGFLRNSIVLDPLNRKAAFHYPPVIHIDIVKGNTLKLTVIPKGFGCENKSRLKMFLPTATIEEIEEFIVGAVKDAGHDACPPYIVGVGIGGTADQAMHLAKKALLKKLHASRLQIRALEKQVMDKINQLRIGPMGLGGVTTCLAVTIETHPTHIAGLPVAVNISCHALRSATITL